MLKEMEYFLKTILEVIKKENNLVDENFLKGTYKESEDFHNGNPRIIQLFFKLFDFFFISSSQQFSAKFKHQQCASFFFQLHNTGL